MLRVFLCVYYLSVYVSVIFLTVLHDSIIINGPITAEAAVRHKTKD